MTCPEKFRRERLHDEWPKKSLDAFIGSVHHRSLERIIGGKLRGTLQPSNETLISESTTEVIEIDGEPEWKEKPENVAALGVLMLNSAEQALVPYVTRPEAIEAEFNERIPGVPVPIMGHIDVIAAVANWEFKTAKQKQSKPKAKWTMQGRIYQLFSPKPIIWGVTTKQKQPVSYSPFHDDTPNLCLPLVNPDTTVLMIQRGIEMLNELHARYGPDEPWPMTGLMHDYYCDYCHFGPKNPVPTCPAWVNG